MKCNVQKKTKQKGKRTLEFVIKHKEERKKEEEIKKEERKEGRNRKKEKKEKGKKQCTARLGKRSTKKCDVYCDML